MEKVVHFVCAEYFLGAEQGDTGFCSLFFECRENGLGIVCFWENTIPVRCVCLDTCFMKESGQFAVVETCQCRSHETPVASERSHEYIVGKCVCQVASSSACRFEFGARSGKLFQKQYLFALPCGSDSSEHTRRPGTDNDKIIHFHEQIFLFV